MDNSLDKNWHSEISKKYAVEIGYVNPINKRNCDYMCESSNKLRQRAIESGYQYFFYLECDLFPHKTIIEDLLIWKQDFVSAPYFISESYKSELCRSEIDLTSKYLLNRNVSTIEGFRDFNGTLKRLDGTGTGCSLISEKLFNMIPFRTISNSPNHADTFFHQDMVAHGFRNMCDTSIIVEHKNQNWYYISPYNFSHQNNFSK